MSKKWYALLLMFLTMVLSGCSLKTASTAPADTTEVLATAATPLKSTEESTDSSQPATDSEVLTSSSLPEKLAMLIPAPEKKTHDDYFSEIRTENIRYIDGGKYNTSVFSHHFDDDGYLYVDYKIDGQRYSRRVNETFDCPFVDVRRNCKFKGTLRKSYFFSADEKSLIQLDPITAEAVAIYTAEVTLKQPEHGWKLGCNIVVFTEQDANGNWRVLRLYEPDGTIDVIEESIPTEPSLNIISNCEYVIRWKNPAYAILEEELAPYYWKAAGYDFRIPEYPGKEVTNYVTDFDQILPQLIYGDHGIFDYYVRYRNTLTGKTVTLGRTPRSAIFYTYIRPDGSEWELSAERVEYEDGQYNMIRFWLYLPANDTDGGFKALNPTMNLSAAIQTFSVQERVQNEYYSQIRDEDMTDTDSLWDGYELRYNSDARLLSLFQEREMAGKRAGDEIKIPIADVSDGSDGLFRRQVYGRTLRRVYAIYKGDRTLMSFEPQNYTLTELYRTEGKLTELVCGQNIVVFIEQMTDGTWRVLRLYEPDGTVDVIEENLSEVAEIKIISNCEFVTMWKNPAYQAVEDANVAAIWADWVPDEPYPGREEADRISNFHEVLPEDVFDRTGVFNYYSRYRNTLSGKTVTVGCIVGCAPLHDYCLLDGTPWTLSNERLYADWEKYDMPRFWLYLPDDDTDGELQSNGTER